MAKTRGSFNGPLAFELSNVYPNPADENIHIEYNVPESMKNSSMSIVLYDLTGRKVYEISGIQPIKGANEHTISLQDKNSPITNGLYILRIATDDYESVSGKVVVCK
jgi:hypothetical protein